MKVRTARDIGILIRDARKRAGISQIELARRNNTNQAWISEIENGKASAEIGMVLQVVNDLGIPMDFGHVPEPTNKLEADTSAVDQDEDEDYAPPPYTI